MTKRRKQLLLQLLRQKKPVTTKELARELKVSEKTIRNDLKQLDGWLSSRSAAEICRRPGVGIFLHASEKEKEKLEHQAIRSFRFPTGTEPVVRRNEMLLDLFFNKKSPTLSEWARQFYVSKATIHHDLAEIGKHLQSFQLRLVRISPSRFCIRGEEKKCRELLARVLSNFPLSRDRRFQQETLIVSDMIRRFEAAMGYSFSDESLSRLIIHLVIAIKRCKTGHVVRLDDGEHSSLKNRKEYVWIGQFAAEIEQKLAFKLPEHEIAYITLYLLSANIHYRSPFYNTVSPLDREAVTWTRQLIKKMEAITHFPFTRDEELFTGLAIHFHTAVIRLKHQLHLPNPMLREIKRLYRYTFETLVFACTWLKEKMDMAFSFPEDEIGYLTLHFQASLERRKNQSRPVKILLVCTTGMGTSQLLAAKITRSFPELQLAATLPESKLDQGIVACRPDLLVSTVPLEHPTVPSICISPLFSEQDREKLADFIKRKRLPFDGKEAFPVIKSWLGSSLVFRDLKASGKEEVIQQLGQQLVRQGYVEPGYVSSAIRREALAGTYIGGGIATPHGLMDQIVKSAVAVAHLPTPVSWDGNPVSFVIIPAIKWTDKEMAEHFYKELVELTDHPADLYELIMTSG
jgi:activator of the mannose operon, transcriptional antiterminator